MSSGVAAALYFGGNAICTGYCDEYVREVARIEGIARRFAVEMSEALVGGTSVGAALLEFRRRLLQNLNPLGLVFTAYGFADLAAPPAPH